MAVIDVDIEDEAAVAEISRRFLLLPEGLAKAIKDTINPEVKRVSAKMLANVSGGVLRQVTGKLASTVKGYTRQFERGSVIFGRAGSKYYIGRFWEGGFNLKMRNGQTKWMQPKKWARPAITGEAERIGRRVEQTILDFVRQKGL